MHVRAQEGTGGIQWPWATSARVARRRVAAARDFMLAMWTGMEWLRRFEWSAESCLVDFNPLLPPFVRPYILVPK
jgi:hypothetical protein